MKSVIPGHGSQSFWTWVFPALAFATGLGSGVLLTKAWEVERQTRVVQERLSQMPPRPTLYDRLDALEQRLQAIQDQLAATSRHE